MNPPNPQIPKPAASTVSPVGRWNAFHPTWQAPIDILASGTFTAASHGSGAWAFDGRYLTLTWAQNRPNEVLELQSDGTFYRMCPQGSFTLRRS
jgi:hypothetical protein